MKKKVLIIISLFIVIGAIILFIVLFNKKELKTVSDKRITVINNKVEVYSKVKLSNIILLDSNLELLDDYLIDTSDLKEELLLISYLDKEDGYTKEDSFMVEVVDTTPPYIGVNDNYNHIINTNFTINSDVICGDNYDKEVICELIGDYDLEVLGKQKVKLVAEDSHGNKTEKEFNLNVVEKSINDNTVIDFKDVVIPDNASLLIDVSKWEEDIDWKTVKESGINYAMIRLGTQRAVDEGSVVDSYFEKNIKEAQEVGIKVGVYYFSYANDKKDAKEQAEWVIDSLKSYNIDLFVAFDWECWKYFNDFKISFHDLNEIGDTFLKTIEDAGYKGINYGSKKYLENVWDLDSYDTWLAHYTDNTDYSRSYTIWQFTESGKVDGIKGTVDLNLYYNK